MSIEIASIIAGSNVPLNLVLEDISSSGVAAVDFTGYTGLSASAKNVDTGTVANFSSVAVTSATAGQLALNYATTAFAAGLYTIQIKGTSPSGKTAIFPSEEGQLKLRVGAANS